MCVDVVKVSHSSDDASPGRAGPSHVSIYRLVAAWCLFSPLIWSLPGMPGFIALTIVANASAVVVLPVLSGSLWYITARTSFIGSEYGNKWWENCLMGGLFVLSVWGAYQSVIAISTVLQS